jgi:hypothetical protein
MENRLKCFVFLNLQIAVFDRQGNQVSALQTGLMTLWAEYAERQGYDPDGASIEVAAGVRWRIRKTEIGWRCEPDP